MSRFTSFAVNGQWCCWENGAQGEARERALQQEAGRLAAQAAMRDAQRRLELEMMLDNDARRNDEGSAGL